MTKNAFLPIIAMTVAAVWAAPALADTLGDGTEIRAEDAVRLEMLNEFAGRAFRQALGGGSEPDVLALTQAMRGTPRDIDPGALVGDWSCQMMKLGDISPLVVYSPFKCRIEKDGDKVLFRKLTGSQQTRGSLHPDGDRIVYLGTSYIQGDTPVDYADLPANVDSASQPQRLPDVAVLESVSDNHARLIFPDPLLESDMNILDLRR
ncbi:DUF4893 domain-containing protein [Paracoccus pacificus]|uniref:DUF4893 domain-containing protein n=1 Tax=Paracoccus pacificus TaxID=1463598 RepID=A0ABW4R5E5_9RHOB